MRRWCVPAVLVAAVVVAVAAVPRVSRGALHAMELSVDQRVQTLSMDAPFELLGNTRGFYLDGYGAVFTTEVNLSQSTNISPFQPVLPKEYIDKLRLKKRDRVPVLKKCMQEEMVAMAASLDTVPAKEQIVLGVTLYYHQWEETAGLPSQIVMQAERQKLLEVHLGRAGRESLDSVIRVQEF
jgi:hypothetical protein